MENEQQSIQPQAPTQQPVEPVIETSKRKFLTKKRLILALILLVLISIAGTVSSVFLNANKKVACTLEAKLCPDGSSVGRSGPKCEFAKCPTTTSNQIDKTNWKTYQNNYFSFKYPTNLTVKLEKSTQIYPNCQDEFISHTYNDFKFTTGRIVNGYEDYWGFGVVVMQTNSRTIKQEYDDCPFNGSKMQVINLNETDGADEAAKIEINGIISGIIKIYRIGNKFYYLTNFQNELLPPDQKDWTPASVRQQILSTFKFFASNEATPTPTCRPRPACLDATPRCLIPETEDMCPKSNNLNPTPSKEGFTETGCKVGGCSGEICQSSTDEPIMSTCIYKAEYACYNSAKCEKQQDGKCGWTQTSELTSCLSGTK